MHLFLLNYFIPTLIIPFRQLHHFIWGISLKIVKIYIWLPSAGITIQTHSVVRAIQILNILNIQPHYYKILLILKHIYV